MKTEQMLSTAVFIIFATCTVNLVTVETAAEQQPNLLFIAVDDLNTLPIYLKANGYYTAGAGKIFHKPRGEMYIPQILELSCRLDSVLQENS